jgi:hypothetical protein
MFSTWQKAALGESSGVTGGYIVPLRSAHPDDEGRFTRMIPRERLDAFMLLKGL